MNFIEKLLDSKNSISSKRFTTLVTLLLLCIVVIAALFGIEVSESIIYSLASLISIGIGSTLINYSGQTQPRNYKRNNNVSNKPSGFDETMPTNI